MEQPKTQLSAARKRATNKYLHEKIDEIKVRVPKGRKADLQAHAQARGESLNGFITRAVDEQIKRDDGAVTERKTECVTEDERES